MPHCVGCCAIELLSGGFWLSVKSCGAESVGQNQAACLQASGLSNAACVEFLVPEYGVKFEIAFKKLDFCILLI